jgi:hypothetical protein
LAWAQSLHKNNNNTSTPSTTTITSSSSTLERMDQVFTRMQQLAQLYPSIIRRTTSTTRQIYQALMNAWSHSYTRTGAIRADELLAQLWDLYHNSTYNNHTDVLDDDHILVPTMSCYVATLNAMARAGGGKKWALRAEELLEEMERWSRTQPPKYAHLQPTTTCVNIVL